MWVKQCHKPPISEWFIHVYRIYENGEIDGIYMGWFMALISPQLPGLVNVYSLWTWKWPSRNSGFSMVFPLNMVICHSYGNVYQRVNLHFPMVFLWVSHSFSSCSSSAESLNRWAFLAGYLPAPWAPNVRSGLQKPTRDVKSSCFIRKMMTLLYCMLYIYIYTVYYIYIYRYFEYTIWYNNFQLGHLASGPKNYPRVNIHRFWQTHRSVNVIIPYPWQATGSTTWIN